MNLWLEDGTGTSYQMSFTDLAEATIFAERLRSTRNPDDRVLSIKDTYGHTLWRLT